MTDLCLKAASGLGVSQSGAGEAERPTPGAGCEVLQGPGGAKQVLYPRERTSEAGGSIRRIVVLRLNGLRQVAVTFYGAVLGVIHFALCECVSFFFFFMSSSQDKRFV